MNNQEDNRINELIKEAVKREVNAVLKNQSFTGRKLTDNPTDDLQTVNRRFLRKIELNTQTDSYTAKLSDAGKVVRINKGTANNFTIPPNSTTPFATGSKIMIEQAGAGTTTIVAGSGVTLNVSSSLSLVLNGQNAVAGLYKIDTDEWIVIGDLV